MVEVMSLKHGFSLVIIILLCHNVALQSPEQEDPSTDIENNMSKGDTSSDKENIMSKGDKSDDMYDSREMEEATPGANVTVPEDVSNSEEKENFETKPATFRWPSGTVPYHIRRRDYDGIIIARIRAAMDEIERSSCVLFKDVSRDTEAKKDHTPWLSIENKGQELECSHTTYREVGSPKRTKAILIVGYDCMQYRDILHSLLHALGFADEVTHPQRDKYVRIVWPNIQPAYRSYFFIKKSKIPQTMVEYDSMSVMHFHDRAYTVNGKPTIVPQVPGLLIAPSDTLSQLDVMKLRISFGHVCNKRKVADLFQTCQNVLIKNL